VYVTQVSQLMASGYRVYAYAGNYTRDAHEQANKVRDYIHERFPELPVYVNFRSPRWLCTVGDFLYYEEAYEVMRQLKAKTPYKGLLILRNQEINLPL
ncbi:MAG: SPOR domain-containing protein, partial [Bacteroidaceae bacterium]|nr:SPOR domain-containing protein [Bacteroidaceae bacterium]